MNTIEVGLKKIVVDVSPEFHRKFKTIVTERGTTIRAVLIPFIEAYIEKGGDREVVNKTKPIESVAKNPDRNSNPDGRLEKIENTLKSLAVAVSKTQAPVDNKELNDTEVHTLKKPPSAKKAPPGRAVKSVKVSIDQRNKKTRLEAKAEGIATLFECHDCKLLLKDGDSLFYHLRDDHGYSEDDAEKMTADVEAMVSSKKSPKNNPDSKKGEKRIRGIFPWIEEFDEKKRKWVLVNPIKYLFDAGETDDE